MQIKASVDGNNIVTERGIHDASVVGFCLVNDIFELSCVQNDSYAIKIQFLNVSDLGFHRFSNHVILYDISCWKFCDLGNNESIENAAWNTLLGEHFSSIDVGGYPAKYLSRSPNDKLIYISTSIGGNAALVCSDMLIEPQAPN